MVDEIRKKWRSPKEIIMSVIALMVIGTYCYMVKTGPPSDIDIEVYTETMRNFKDIVLIVITFYYSGKFLKQAGNNAL